MWNYYRNILSNLLSFNSESFKYKRSVTGNTYNVDGVEAGYDEAELVKTKLKFLFR